MNRSISNRTEADDHRVRRFARRLLDALKGSQRDAVGLEVRLLTSDCGPAASDEVAAILAQLCGSGRKQLDSLVRDAAETLYRSEMARGGANFDLGLLGPCLFVPSIRSAIDAGHGCLWEVRAREHQSDVA